MISLIDALIAVWSGFISHPILIVLGLFAATALSYLIGLLLLVLNDHIKSKVVSCVCLILSGVLIFISVFMSWASGIYALLVIVGGIFSIAI